MEGAAGSYGWNCVAGKAIQIKNDIFLLTASQHSVIASAKSTTFLKIKTFLMINSLLSRYLDIKSMHPEACVLPVFSAWEWVLP